MKLICEGLDLSDAVLKVSKATAIKTTNPILEGIKLKAEDDRLILSATDLELSIEKVISADVKVEGECVVPGRFFTDFTKKLSNEKIELTLTDKDLLKVKYTDSEGFIQCLNKEEFPLLKNIDNPESFKITHKDLKDLITKTIFSVALDDSRPILKGCLFEILNGKVTSVALDGYRLAKVSKNIVESTAEFSFVIPARSLAEIGKMLDDSDNLIKVNVQKNFLLVEFSDTKILTRLIDGDFINYNQVIPQNITTTIKVNKNQLMNGIERASLLSRFDKNNLVKLDIKENLLVLTSNSELGNIKENITVSIKGKDILIAFNARYLIESLRVIDDEFVKINFTSPIAPCTIVPDNSDDALYLILPVRVVG